MTIQGVEICCPQCHEDLEQISESSIRCTSCQRQFPVVAGIPDLRLWPDPYIGIREDREKGLRLAERMKELSFHELIDHYYETTSVVPQHHARIYKRGLIAGAARARSTLTCWESACRSNGGPAGTFLDVGCGTAPLLVEALRRFRSAIGVDIAFRWLVVAKKRVCDAGLNIPLICACAEALPFRESAFDWVSLDSTIEHVRDQPVVLAECHRVMRAGGHLFASTPNRFSVGPDPHLGVWAGSLWPKAWLESYARRVKAIPPNRQLLSKRSLVRLTEAAGFERPQVLLADIATSQRDQRRKPIRLLIDLYEIARKSFFTRELLFWLGPKFHIVTRKPH